MLKNHLVERDAGLDIVALIKKYHSELTEMCKFDKDTEKTFGRVNTWWVFSTVSEKLNQSVFMAEADNIGYKRTKRGEKWMPNDLFRSNNNGEVLVDDGIETSILDFVRKVHWEQ